MSLKVPISMDKSSFLKIFMVLREIRLSNILKGPTILDIYKKSLVKNPHITLGFPIFLIIV